MVIVREFSGGLDMDTHPSRVKSTDYVDAFNITHNAKEKAGVVSPLKGNQSVAFSMPAGVPITIGAKEDKLRNCIIECIYHPDGYHTIVKYDRTAGTRTKILQSKTDTGGVDILGWTPDNRIRGIDILHRAISEGDLLFINDGNSRPIGFNIKTIGDYAPSITDDLIRAAKQPPLTEPTVAYASDTTKKVNYLRKKLFQFRYRWVYKDGYKSTWSPISERPIPVSGYSVVTDTDPTNNNAIDILLTGGGQDYQKIEIAGRECLGVTWGDFYLIESLDRDDYDIDPSATFTYRFYNDGAYTTLDTAESDLLFDYYPDLANSQSLVNGNTLVYGGITEGYDKVARTQVNVQMGYRLIDTSASPTPGSPANLSYYISASPSSSPTDYRLFVVMGPNVNVGDVFHVSFVTAPISGTTFSCNVDYTSTVTVLATALEGLRAAIDAALGPNFTVQTISADTIRIETHVSPSVGPQLYNSVQVYATSAPSSGGGSVAVWKWNSLYRFGLVYFDKYGKTNGVVSYLPIDGDTNNFTVMTPDFVVYSGNSYAPRVSVITASINHLPPSWAETFQWVRTPNLTVSKFLQYVTCQTDEDDDYIYFCIENLDKFKLSNTGFTPSYDFVKGDRLRVMNVLNTGSTPRYSETYYSDDYEIIGVESREITDPTNPDSDVTGRFIKVKRPSSSISYDSTMLIEIYTPALRNSDDEQVFFEFGEGGAIYTESGVRYHSGGIQHQNAGQPAKFEFRNGDVYLKFRKIYDFHFSETLGPFSVSMMDANYSDYWSSAVNSNGRPNVIDPNAKREKNPALFRFGNSYQSGTTINGLNRFYPLNYIEVNRSFGEVQKTIEWNNSLVVFQEYKIGRMPVLQAIVQYADGQQSTVISQKLLNRIQYYLGQFGVGTSWESVAEAEGEIFGWDNTFGVNWRLSQGGLDRISKQKNINSFAVANSIGRKIYGVYDTENDLYMSFFPATETQAANSIVWNERRKSYESRLGYAPEMVCCLNGLIVAWKNGVLWTHDSDTFNSFFGEVQESFIIPVFNDNASAKKSFDAITTLSGDAWDVPTMQTNVYSYSAQVQATLIKSGAFIYSEGEYHAAIPKDANSDKGAINGASMKGQWIKMKIRKESPTSLSYLNAVIVTDTTSPKNPS